MASVAEAVITFRGDASDLQQAGKHAEAVFQSLREHAARTLEIFAGFEGAHLFEAAIEKTKEFLTEAAKLGFHAQIAEDAFATLTRSAGVAGHALLEQLQKASGGIVEEAAIIQSSTRGILAGLQPQQLVNFMEIARQTSKVTGDSVADAYDKITTAVSNHQVRGLKSMTLFIDSKAANDDYAKSLGTTADRLTEFQQVQALAIAVQAKGKVAIDALSGATAGHKEVVEKLTAAWEGFKVSLGKSLVDEGFAVLDWLATMSGRLEGLRPIVDAFGAIWSATWKSAVVVAQPVVSILSDSLIPFLKVAAVAASAFGVGMTAGFSVIAGPLTYIASILDDLASKKWPSHTRATLEANVATAEARQRLAEAVEGFEKFQHSGDAAAATTKKVGDEAHKAALGVNTLGQSTSRGLDDKLIKQAGEAMGGLVAKLFEFGSAADRDQHLVFELTKSIRDLPDLPIFAGFKAAAENIAQQIVANKMWRDALDSDVAALQRVAAAAESASAASLAARQRLADATVKLTGTALEAQLQALDRETIANLDAATTQVKDNRLLSQTISNIWKTDAVRRAEILIGSTKLETDQLRDEWNDRLRGYADLLAKGTISQARFEELVRNGSEVTTSKLIAQNQRRLDSEQIAQVQSLQLQAQSQQEAGRYFGFLGTQFALVAAQSATFYQGLAGVAQQTFGNLTRFASDFLFNFITGTATAADAFKQFGMSMLRTITDFLAQQAVRTFLSVLFGGKGGSGMDQWLHDGGIAGAFSVGGAGALGLGLGANDIPAVLERGEAVLSGDTWTKLKDLVGLGEGPSAFGKLKDFVSGGASGVVDNVSTWISANPGLTAGGAASIIGLALSMSGNPDAAKAGQIIAALGPLVGVGTSLAIGGISGATGVALGTSAAATAGAAAGSAGAGIGAAAGTLGAAAGAGAAIAWAMLPLIIGPMISGRKPEKWDPIEHMFINQLGDSIPSGVTPAWGALLGKSRDDVARILGVDTNGFITAAGARQEGGNTQAMLLNGGASVVAPGNPLARLLNPTSNPAYDPLSIILAGQDITLGDYLQKVSQDTSGFGDGASSFKTGLDRVPGGESEPWGPVYLHGRERVLTAAQADVQDAGRRNGRQARAASRFSATVTLKRDMAAGSKIDLRDIQDAFSEASRKRVKLGTNDVLVEVKRG